MSELNTVAEQYIAVWNETDADARRAAIGKLMTSEITYIDPMAVAEGAEAFDATVAAVQGQFPDFTFRLAGTPDGHHDQVRFTWELGPADGEAMVVGFDVAVLAADGRIKAVYGFLDKVPAL
ncbi:nuclear transport factor 2 family protein [Amycolatopsis rhizosphaerae]|uniref:Nuclear transport factor 2 family protein n=1 Tax=Amycolatopsis rhizosphaerae TaxID=2053003 RepID=A0A558CBR3_9PSEU|nr:nuclear transport factor 2 family protein [Amycolatopsis rhizosphaerae]TVT46231.1 nuclear transport factor 2 family protein [Amycolatopsis rhizosphaerae]